jgi:hypothetical protein
MITPRLSQLTRELRQLPQSRPAEEMQTPILSLASRLDELAMELNHSTLLAPTRRSLRVVSLRLRTVARGLPAASVLRGYEPTIALHDLARELERIGEILNRRHV